MIRFTIILAIAGITVFGVGGCTDIERAGYSPIPQNSPGSWSGHPYGDLQN